MFSPSDLAKGSLQDKVGTDRRPEPTHPKRSRPAFTTQACPEISRPQTRRFHVYPAGPNCLPTRIFSRPPTMWPDNIDLPPSSAGGCCAATLQGTCPHPEETPRSTAANRNQPAREDQFIRGTAPESPSPRLRRTGRVAAVTPHTPEPHLPAVDVPSAGYPVSSSAAGLFVFTFGVRTFCALRKSLTLCDIQATSV